MDNGKRQDRRTQTHHPSGKKQHRTLRLAPDVLACVDEIATGLECGFSAVVEDILRGYCANRQGSLEVPRDDERFGERRGTTLHLNDYGAGWQDGAEAQWAEIMMGTL